MVSVYERNVFIRRDESLNDSFIAKGITSTQSSIRDQDHGVENQWVPSDGVGNTQTFLISNVEVCNIMPGPDVRTLWCL